MRTIHIVVDSPVPADLETVRKAAAEAGLSVEVTGATTTDPKRTRISLGSLRPFTDGADRVCDLHRENRDAICFAVVDGIGTRENGLRSVGATVISATFPDWLGPAMAARPHPGSFWPVDRMNDRPMRYEELTEAVGIPHATAQAVFAANGALSIGEALHTVNPGPQFDQDEWRQRHDPASGYDPNDWEAVHSDDKSRAQLIGAKLAPIFRWVKGAVGMQGTVDPKEGLPT